MTYRDIIYQNYINLGNLWWTRFAFHYTDISNAVNIMKTGYLFSRANAANYSIMKNDNASRQVINMTNAETTSYVRFYYRPLTPTQFHNEGYKHPSIRYCQDSYANVPVPVFFVFDLERLLNTPGTLFSEVSLAGGGEKLKTGVEEFSKLNFEQIYKSGHMDNPEMEKKYRHAEIVYPGQFEINSSLSAVICRNDVERKSLLNLLRNQSTKLFDFYQKKIIVRDDCFEKNGVYISECEYIGTTATIAFSNTSNKNYYTRRNRRDESKLEFIAHVDFHWDKKDERLLTQSCEFIVDYDNCSTMTFTGLNKPKNATVLYMQVYFEDKQMCCMCWQLAEAAML